MSALALTVAACGGSSNDSEGASDAPEVVVSTKEFPGYGKVLTNEDGRPLYVLDADPKGGSKCADACAQQWPPVSGNASASGDVEESMLDSFKRDDGKQQVLYNGHALYTNTGEALAGIGTKSEGGTWYLVSAKGDPIKTTQVGGY
jgi:predicted lipoprotein with Yx(FWY)xxD motif